MDREIGGVRPYKILCVIFFVPRARQSMCIADRNIGDVPGLFVYEGHILPVQVYVAHQCNFVFMITKTKMGAVALTARIGI